MCAYAHTYVLNEKLLIVSRTVYLNLFDNVTDNPTLKQTYDLSTNSIHTFTCNISLSIVER